ncbi:hypothetical protein ABFS82_14G160800 [Erythranthe guttata]
MESREGKMKAHYNISMSRRTRKPVNYVKVKPRQDQEDEEASFYERENNGDWSFRERNDDDDDDDIEELQKRSLKQLSDGRRCTLAQYFKEEENMLLISREYSVDEEDDELIDGVIKLKRMVRDCARGFFNRLIKVKQEPYIFRSWRKPKPVSLKYIKHK